MSTTALAKSDTPQNGEKGNKNNKSVTYSDGLQYTPDQATVIDESNILKAYSVDSDGKITKGYQNIPSKSNGGVSVQGFTDGSYFYDWAYYNPNTYQTSWQDRKHFPIGSVYAQNNSPNPMVISYSQANTKTTTWTFTGKVSGEAGFTVAVLASAKLTVGFDVSTQRTTTSTSTITSTATISAYKQGEIDAYHTGVYSGGYGVWNKYYVTPQGTHINAGTYNEFGSAWTVGLNNINYFFTQW
ncbi:hypothetical protein B5M42_008190 [Paenibacillus athensensis]|uniref:hypothetical protein n=1 Tax=Paenibacillus athensensis TaxID=1967502 RepID=UPI001E548434|nr:hypothetical protein [Paenibacillus athensensis]MCD1258813.1 hypothetical protein [Paenibacillus athensensis]